MEARARRFGGMQELATVNGIECLAERNVRVRQRSGIHRDVNQRQVICPEPRRLPIVPSLADEIYKSGRRLHSHSAMQTEGEACREILDIFFVKSGYGDQANVNSSLPHFSGSPPTRSHNPLIHDVKFIKKELAPPPINVSQKSSCGSSFGANPSVRVEGFSCSSSEKHCIVSALAWSPLPPFWGTAPKLLFLYKILYNAIRVERSGCSGKCTDCIFLGVRGKLAKCDLFLHVPMRRLSYTCWRVFLYTGFCLWALKIVCRDKYFLSDFCQNLKVRTFSSIYGDNCTVGNLVIM